MKVLLVTTHLNYGGITNYILTLARSLRKKGVDVLVASSGGEVEAEFAKDGIGHKRVDIGTKFEFSPRVFLAVRTLAKLIRDEKITLVHGHTRVSQVASSFAARTTKIPYVSTCHGFFRPRLGRKLFGFWGERVIAISEGVREHLVEDLKVDPRKIELVYNGVELDKFSRSYSENDLRDFKSCLGMKDASIIGTIGRLSPVKGHKFFIEAFKAISLKRGGLRGLIVGDGPEENSLKRLVKDMGLEGSFSFLRSTCDTGKLLAIMDIFVFPSLKEGLGLSLLEAMAAGRACVASDVGGIKDIIRDYNTGLLVKPESPMKLETAIVELLENDDLRKDLGENARDLVTKSFSLDTMTEEILDVYEKAQGFYGTK